MGRFSRAVVAVVLGVLVSAALTASATPAGPARDVAPASSAAPAASAAFAEEPDPNIVLILMDDFSLELLATMPQARRMAAEGATFRNAFVVDSLCCPSRAALMTGRMPHQNGVRTNTPNSAKNPIGGWRAFRRYGNLERQFAVSLRRDGYRTGFVGKFLNGYRSRKSDGGATLPPAKVPGWTTWNAVLDGGYNGWDFASTYLDGDGKVRLRDHPKPPRRSSIARLDASYSTTVIGDLAVDFLERQDGAKPYFLEVATYGPHSQLAKAYPDNPTFPPAFADRPDPATGDTGNCGPRGCESLTLKDLVGYNDPKRDNRPTYLNADGSTSPAPAWRTNRATLSGPDALKRYRDRARMVASIDRMIARVREAVGDDDTYVFLTSDNGFHLGQHRLNGGKGTPYDSDTRVPLVVVGPDVDQGVRSQWVSNIDLAPTFERLAGITVPGYRSGRPFAGALARPGSPGGRYVFFEHTYARSGPGEADLDRLSQGTINLIPSYVAIRGPRGLLARFDLDKSPRGVRYAYELYQYGDGFEKTNVFARDHRRPYARGLMRRLKLADDCRPDVCRAATR